jgi:hypothetical protein
MLELQHLTRRFVSHACPIDPIFITVAAIVSFLPSRGSTTMPLDSKAPLCRSTGKSLLPCVLRGSFVSNGTVYMSTHDTFGCSKVRIFSDSLHISATEQVCPRQLSHKTPGLAILKTLTPLSRNNFHHVRRSIEAAQDVNKR